MYFFFCFFFVFLGWLLLFFFSVESKRNETKRIKRLIFGNARSKLMLLKAAVMEKGGWREGRTRYQEVLAIYLQEDNLV